MMPLGFSSIGQPELSLAQESDPGFLELRVLEGSLNLPGYFHARHVTMPQVPVSVAASSLRLTKTTASDMKDFFRLENIRNIFLCSMSGSLV